MAKRRGFLTPTTFFPRTGDAFINAEDELVPLWECARANQWIDPKSGSKVRYALLVSTCVDEEIGLVDRSLSESSDMADFLEGFHEIHRTGKKYERTENGTFVEA